MGGGSSTTIYIYIYIYEEWDSNRQKPYKHREIERGEDTISKTLAKLYTKWLSERRISTAWKNAKMIINFKKRKKDLKNYRSICVLSNIYKVLTKVLKTLENILSRSASHSSTTRKLRLSANSSSTDIASRTVDRRCVHRPP